MKKQIFMIVIVTAALLLGILTTIPPAAGIEASANEDSCLLEFFPTANEADQQRIIRAASAEPMGVQWCFLPPENRGR